MGAWYGEPTTVASGKPGTLAVVLIVFDIASTTVTCGKMLEPVPEPAVPLPLVALCAWKQVPGQAVVPLRIAPTIKVPSNPVPVPVTVIDTPRVRSCPAVKV